MIPGRCADLLGGIYGCDLNKKWRSLCNNVVLGVLWACKISKSSQKLKLLGGMPTMLLYSNTPPSCVVLYKLSAQHAYGPIQTKIRECKQINKRNT